jgi:hypothetical protein
MPCTIAGAHHYATFAPERRFFLSGFLFSADALELYEGLPQLVWIAHSVRGDFTD